MLIKGPQIFDAEVAKELLGAGDSDNFFRVALAEQFSDELTSIVARYGLQNEYARCQRTCGSVRGTIDFSAQLRKRPGS